MVKETSDQVTGKIAFVHGSIQDMIVVADQQINNTKIIAKNMSSMTADANAAVSGSAANMMVGKNLMNKIATLEKNVGN